MEEEETYEVKLMFNNEQIDVSLSSKYEFFINLVCNILKISTEQMDELALSYKDSDGDNIIISSPEDYEIFFTQVAQKTVDGFIIKIKEDSNIDQNNCLINFINYKDSIEGNNNINKQDIDNNINYNRNENNNMNNYMNYNYNNDNKNINNNINYNNPTYNNYNEINNNKDKDNNNDVPIENIIFYYKCSSCNLYPIVCKIYYCAKCSFYLCPECKQKNVGHQHQLLEIDSKEKLREIKDKENDELDKKRKIKENQAKNALKQYNQNMNVNNNYPQNSRQNQNNQRRNYCINSNNNYYQNNGLYFQCPQHNQQNMYQNCNQYHNQYQFIEPHRHQYKLINNFQNNNQFGCPNYNNHNHNCPYNNRNNELYNNQNRNDYQNYLNYYHLNYNY